MRRFLRRWVGVPGRGLRRPLLDYIAVALALCAVPTAWMALRVVPFRRLIRDDQAETPELRPTDSNAQTPSSSYLETPLPKPPLSKPLLPRGAVLSPFDRRICWAVEAVGHRLFPRRPCLVQAIAAKWLLKWRGLAPTLHIGVQRTKASIRAHAWLVYDQEIIVGGKDSARVYQAFTGLDVPSHLDATSGTVPSNESPRTASRRRDPSTASQASGASSTSETPKRR